MRSIFCDYGDLPLRLIKIVDKLLLAQLIAVFLTLA
jgi:hypothetical protein